MTFWDWLDRRWPSERAWVTIALALLIAGLLQMAADNPGLWRVELFKTLLTASVVTGALNMVLAFHFAANKADEAKTANTARAFAAIEAAARSGGGTDAAAGEAAEQVAEASADEAAAIKGDKPEGDKP